MHTVSIQPIASERLKHLETRGSNDVCGSLVMGITSRLSVKVVTLSRWERYRLHPMRVYMAQTVSALRADAAPLTSQQRRSRLPPYYDHSLASASAQALQPRGSHYAEEVGEARNQLLLGMFAQEFCRL